MLKGTDYQMTILLTHTRIVSYALKEGIHSRGNYIHREDAYILADFAKRQVLLEEIAQEIEKGIVMCKFIGMLHPYFTTFRKHV